METLPLKMQLNTGTLEIEGKKCTTFWLVFFGKQGFVVSVRKTPSRLASMIS